MKYLDKNISKYIFVTFIVLFFIFMGINIYISYEKNVDKNDDGIIHNYYNFEFLFNNGYIKIADDITGMDEKNSNFYMYLSDDVLHVKYKIDDKEYNKEIFGLPSSNLKIYYNRLSLNCLEVAGLSGNELYYNNFCLDDNKIKDFEMISTEVKDVYASSFDKSNIYVVDNNSFKSNFIINTTLNELKYISYKDGVGGLYNNIEKVKPYFDYICVDEGFNLCKNTMIYLNFNGELLYKYDLEDSIKDENGNLILVQDMFGTFEINNKRSIDFDNLDFKTLYKYDYLYFVYILDKESNLYVLSIKRDNFKTKTLGDAFLYSSEKVNNIDYQKDEEGKISKVVITFVDGEIKELESRDNFSIFDSTLVGRNVSGVISAK